jgi:transposase
MSVRLLLTDETWAEIAPILATLKSRAGSPPVLSDRMFLEAVLYLARTGTPWRDLPADFGHWDAVYNRFRRWERRGIWRRLWERLQGGDCPLTCDLFIDATIVRAHQHAAGALKKTADTPHRLWAALGAASPRKSMPAVAMNAPASP